MCSPFSLALKLDKFLFFKDFFPNLADFWDFDNFPIFNNFWDLDNFLVFNNFPYFSMNLLPSSMPPILLAASTLTATSTYNNTVVFSIDISDVAILL